MEKCFLRPVRWFTVNLTRQLLRLQTVRPRSFHLGENFVVRSISGSFKIAEAFLENPGWSTMIQFTRIDIRWKYDVLKSSSTNLSLCFSNPVRPMFPASWKRTWRTTCLNWLAMRTELEQLPRKLKESNLRIISLRRNIIFQNLLFEIPTVSFGLYPRNWSSSQLATLPPPPDVVEVMNTLDFWLEFNGSKSWFPKRGPLWSNFQQTTTVKLSQTTNDPSSWRSDVWRNLFEIWRKGWCLLHTLSFHDELAVGLVQKNPQLPNSPPFWLLRSLNRGRRFVFSQLAESSAYSRTSCDVNPYY